MFDATDQRNTSATVHTVVGAITTVRTVKTLPSRAIVRFYLHSSINHQSVLHCNCNCNCDWGTCIAPLGTILAKTGRGYSADTI